MRKHFLSKSGFARMLNAETPFVEKRIFVGGGGGKGNDPEETELEAIEKIGTQIDEFKTMLGDKADNAEFEAAKLELKTLKDGLADLTAKELSNSIDLINKANASFQKQIIELQEKAAENAEKATSGKKSKEKFVTKEMLDAFIKSTFDESGKKTHDHAELELKAAEIFGYPNFFDTADGVDVTAFTGRYIDPTLYMRKRKRNLILDNFDIQTIDVPNLVYLEKVEVGDTNPTSGDPGSAAWILSGQAKPMRSFKVKSATSTAKKVAIFGTVQDELLKDVASLENWMQDDFMLEMKEKINDGLLNNNIAINALAPQGLKTNAIQYSVTPAFNQTLSNVTYIDALIAIFALFRQNKEQAALAFVSSDIMYAILSLKDTQARYLNNPLIYTNNIGQLFIAGVQVIDSDAEDVPSDHVLVIGADLGFKIKAYGTMVFERGLNADDFRNDRTSYRGYQRFITYIPSNRYNSVLYDSWANIFAAIAKP